MHQLSNKNKLLIDLGLKTYFMLVIIVPIIPRSRIWYCVERVGKVSVLRYTWLSAFTLNYNPMILNTAWDYFISFKAKAHRIF